MSQVDYIHFFSNMVWSMFFFFLMYMLMCLFYVQNVYMIVSLSNNIFNIIFLLSKHFMIIIEMFNLVYCNDCLVRNMSFVTMDSFSKGNNYLIYKLLCI